MSASEPWSEVDPEPAQPAWARRALVTAALLAGAALLAWPQLDRPAAEGAARAPSLPVRARVCEAAETQRAAHALDAERRAQAKIARYPYAPAEGLAAFALLALAADCHAKGGDTQAQQRASRRALAWRARLERDYRAELLRFEHGAQPDAARFLLELLAGESGPFIARLRRAQSAAGLAAKGEGP